MLDARWISANADRFDVVHLHFGMESYSVAHVAEALAEARAHQKPVVFTVHDLQNPQLHDQSEHERMLDLVIPAADELITLTESARREITRRWQRDARVVPHPPILDPAAGRPTGTLAAARRIGVHLRDLRPNLDAVGTVTTLIRALRLLPDVEADVHLNERVRDDETAQLLHALVGAAPGIRLHRTPRLSDDELAASVADLDACVLPYGHGTHSGWRELAYDLAVPVIGPAVGHFASQHPEDYFPFDIGAPASLAAAITRATDASTRPGSPDRAVAVAQRAQRRRIEAERIRAAHSEVYRSVCDRRVAA